MSCGINVTNLMAVESLTDFKDVCDCCAEGSIVYVKDEKAFYQFQYGQLVKRVDLPFVKLDENGRAQIETPAANDDIANKQYVDNAVAAGKGVPAPALGSTFVFSTDNSDFTLPAGGMWIWWAQLTTRDLFTWPLRAGISPGGTVINKRMAGAAGDTQDSAERSCFAWKIA